MSDARLLAAEAVESYVRAFFEGHSVEVVDYDLGPERREVVPDLRVLVVGPGPRSDSWAYVTAGCWAVMETDGHGLEFVMTAHVRDQRFIELMAMIAYYHRGGHQLDLEHSMPIGEPWVPGSSCDHLLVSLPYLHGPDLEHCLVPGGHARVLWTLPVTTAEIEFRRRHGHEALEQLFDGVGAALRQGRDHPHRSFQGVGCLSFRPPAVTDCGRQGSIGSRFRQPR